MSPRVDKVEQRKKILGEFTVMKDLMEVPLTNDPLPYTYFNTDFYSNDRNYEEVADILHNNLDKMIDVRPYMIETPFLA